MAHGTRGAPGYPDSYCVARVGGNRTWAKTLSEGECPNPFKNRFSCPSLLFQMFMFLWGQVLLPQDWGPVLGLPRRIKGARVKATYREGCVSESEGLREVRVRKPEVFNLEGSYPQTHTSEEGVLNKGFGRSERVGRVRDREKTQRAKATKGLEKGGQGSDRKLMGIEKKHLGRDSVQGDKGLRGIKLPAPRAKEASPERASVTATSSTAGIDRKGLQGPSDSGPRERKIEGFSDKELESKGMTGSGGRPPKSSDEAELRPDDPVLGVDGTPWSWEGTVDRLESEATEFPVFKVDTSATSYKESFKEAETQTCVPLGYEERRLSVQGCAACGSGLRENRSDASGQTNRVLCLNLVSESYYPGGESIHTQFYNLGGMGPSSTSTSGDIESEAQEPQEVFGVTTSRWNRRNVEGRGPMTRSLSNPSGV